MDNIRSLIRLIDRRIPVQVMLRDGGVLKDFWPHDIIARGSLQSGVVVVRGVISTSADSYQEHTVPLCDIGGVFPVKGDFAAATDSITVQRKPAPRGWTTIHGLP